MRQGRVRMVALEGRGFRVDQMICWTHCFQSDFPSLQWLPSRDDGSLKKDTDSLGWFNLDVRPVSFRFYDLEITFAWFICILNSVAGWWGPIIQNYNEPFEMQDDLETWNPDGPTDRPNKELSTARIKR